jgi:integration host factor subunit alpha
MCGNMALTKAKIVDEIQNHLHFSRQKSVETIETLLEIMKKTMEEGDDILISGFGKFCVKKKKERRGRNPATGEAMMLRPRRVITFKYSKRLRDKINGKEKNW